MLVLKLSAYALNFQNSWGLQVLSGCVCIRTDTMLWNDSGRCILPANFCMKGTFVWKVIIDHYSYPNHLEVRWSSLCSIRIYNVLGYVETSLMQSLWHVSCTFWELAWIGEWTQLFNLPECEISEEVDPGNILLGDNYAFHDLVSSNFTALYILRQW